MLSGYRRGILMIVRGNLGQGIALLERREEECGHVPTVLIRLAHTTHYL